MCSTCMHALLWLQDIFEYLMIYHYVCSNSIFLAKERKDTTSIHLFHGNNKTTNKSHKICCVPICLVAWFGKRYSALVATQIVHDIENYSTNVIGLYNMIVAQEFLTLMVCYKSPQWSKCNWNNIRIWSMSPKILLSTDANPYTRMEWLMGS